MTTSKQSKIDSFMEAACSTTVGFFASLITWAAIAPLLGIPLIWSQSLIITGIFTAVSVLRSYVLRRVFNGRSVWEAMKAASVFGRNYQGLTGPEWAEYGSMIETSQHACLPTSSQIRFEDLKRKRSIS